MSWSTNVSKKRPTNFQGMIFKETNSQTLNPKSAFCNLYTVGLEDI